MMMSSLEGIMTQCQCPSWTKALWILIFPYHSYSEYSPAPAYPPPLNLISLWPTWITCFASQNRAADIKLVQDNAGLDWHHLPKTKLTSDLQRDWQLLRMRGMLNPKHQKKALPIAPPKYCHVGNIVDRQAEFQRGRTTRRENKGTLLEQVTAEYSGTKLQAKYTHIQRTNASGKKAFYQRLVSKRRKRK